MKVAITQANYLPWLGFFELLDKVDLWVSLDNVQLSRRSYIVRNKVKRPGCEASWISLKVQKAPRETHIIEAQLMAGFVELHLNKFEQCYKHAAYFDETMAFFQSTLPLGNEQNVASYNRRIISTICDYIGIELKVVSSVDLEVPLSGTAEDKIIGLSHCVKAKEFYNFQMGIENKLYSAERFSQEGIKLYKQSYMHPEYSQNDDHFEAYLSVVDLLFHQGKSKALGIIQQGRHWQLQN
jgi:hypothetical protein